MLIRIFAVFSFLATQAALLYYAGFLQNWTPVGVDTATGGSLVQDLLLLLCFGLVHSALARPALKRMLYGALNERLNRTVYNLVASAQLGLLMACWSPWTLSLWHVDSAVGAGLVYAAFGAGLGLLFWAIFAIDPWHFFGLRQVFGQAPGPSAALSFRGPYRVLRHPIQTGVILAMWATPHMTAGHALLAAFMTFYSLLATLMLEERDLRAQFGADYERYQQR
ncbi:MAG TPA: NnrU family protein, partial [Telluria sp.]|nr:NnrU family protein [Telluria sp.]